MKLSNYRKEKIAKEEWVDIKTLKDDLKEHFEKVYNDYNFEFFIKSKGFEEKKAFIFCIYPQHAADPLIPAIFK